MATDPIRDGNPGNRERATERESRIGSGISPDHRAILEAALTKRQNPPFNEILASIPNVGLDSDFERSWA